MLCGVFSVGGTAPPPPYPQAGPGVPQYGPSPPGAVPYPAQYPPPQVYTMHGAPPPPG